MIKRLLIVLILLGILTMVFLHSQKTVECWWGIMYPTLSYTTFEDDERDTRISSTEPHYIYLPKNQVEEPVKVKFIFIEWLKELF